MRAARAVPLLLLAVTGCSSAITKTIRAPEQPPTVAALVVTPVRVTGDESPRWRQFELGQREVDVALREVGDHVAIFGPGEVLISRWEEPGWLGNTAVPLITRAAIPVEQALLLRTTVERRIANSTQEREDSSGKGKGGVASQEVTWLATMELLHPSSRAVVAELTASVIIDPFAKPTGEEEFDPAPAMTHLIEDMTREAVKIARRWELDRPSARDARITFALSPAISAGQQDQPQTDALQAEVWIQARTRFLTPWLPEELLTKVARTPAGLYVVAAPGDSGVQAGDLILSIDGSPALPEVLSRKRLRGVPVEVKVSRGGKETDAIIR
ncbi:MAG: hypothetical protein U0228_27455 [Myxococcaceae bacterium]